MNGRTQFQTRRTEVGFSPEHHLIACDSRLKQLIVSGTDRWPTLPTEHPIWGLTRIVMAQQVSTTVACMLAERVKKAYPSLVEGCLDEKLRIVNLRGMGLSTGRAECCVTLFRQSAQILDRVKTGESWEAVLAGIKGVGPWTIGVFRIMVLREPDVLPLGDVGLERAVANVYGMRRNLERLAEKWRPFRSVACWYLWRTLGNKQLG